MSQQRSTHEGRQQPARLLDTDSPAARALAAFDAQTEIADGAEDPAWRRLRQQLRAEDAPTARQGSAYRWLAVTGALAGLTIAVGLTAGQHRRLPQPPTAAVVPESPRAKPLFVQEPAPAPAIAAIPPIGAPPPSLALSSVPRPLPAERVQLDERIAVTAAPGTKASAWVDRGGRQHVELVSGVVELIVSGGKHPVLIVDAGDYHFRDRGTVFEVGRTDPAIWLHVKAGAVGVSKARHALAVIRANHRWSAGVAEAASDTRARPNPSRVPAPASTSGAQAAVDVPAPSETNPRDPAPAVATPETPAAATSAARPTLPDCRALQQQMRDDEAQTCLRALAEGSDLSAETALYELARVQQETLGDTAAALATLRKQRRRFPNGALRDEAELTTIELLPRVGQYRSTLDLSDSFLARHPRHERRAELHLLRANILREVFTDYAAAVREYQEIDAGTGGVADDAAFFLAVSLEADGRKQDAVDAYRRYLTRAAPAHAAVAGARLAALSR